MGAPSSRHSESRSFGNIFGDQVALVRIERARHRRGVHAGRRRNLFERRESCAIHEVFLQLRSSWRLTMAEGLTFCNRLQYRMQTFADKCLETKR